MCPLPIAGFVLGQDFLNLQAQGQGQCWYHREAMRAVNQTLGRVIRHRTSAQWGTFFCKGPKDVVV